MALFIIAFAAGLLYFLPTFLAYRKKHFVTIALVNVFLGWTIVGWIFSIVWAIVDRSAQQPAPTVIDVFEGTDTE